MELVISIFSLLFAMLAFYLQYHASSKEHQESLGTLLRKLLGSTSRIVAYGAVLLIFLASLIGIFHFWSDTDPIHRREVVLLILHFINVFMYGYLTFAIPGKAIIQRYAPQKDISASDTEPA